MVLRLSKSATALSEDGEAAVEGLGTAAETVVVVADRVAAAGGVAAVERVAAAEVVANVRAGGIARGDVDAATGMGTAAEVGAVADDVGEVVEMTVSSTACCGFSMRSQIPPGRKGSRSSASRTA